MSKKKAVPYKLYASRVTIHRQPGSDAFYVRWSLDHKQNIKKITHEEYRSEKDKKHKAHKYYPDAIDGFVIKWYYKVTKGGGYYTGQSIIATSGMRTTASQLWTPPPNAVGIEVSVKPVSKKYQASKNKQDKWFSTSARYIKNPDYDEYPTAPTLGTPTLTKDVMKVVVTLANGNNDIKTVSLQTLKDNARVLPVDNIAYSGTLGFVEFTKDLTSYGSGSYKVRARVRSTDKIGKKKEDLWSDWSGWSTEFNTVPDPPTLISCSAVDTDKIKIVWSSMNNVTDYVIEYTSDSVNLFDGDGVKNVSVSNATSYIISGLTTGHAYYFRVRSKIGEVQSDPSNIIKAVLATKPNPPTTWSSVTVATITQDLATTEAQQLYFSNNSTDGSAMRTAELEFTLNGTVYYLLYTNPNTDSYGNLVDKINELDLWGLTVYTTEGANTTAAGTLFSLFSAGAGNTITWKVRTEGIFDGYSDWSTERAIKAYTKPSLQLTVTDVNGNPLPGDILSAFPIKLVGNATPLSQTPISHYISILANETYETTDAHGDPKTIVEGTEVYSLYINSNEQLNKLISASDVDFVSGVSYTIKVTVFMDSGLKADATYGFSPSWDEEGNTPDAQIDYNDTYRYATIKPFCHYYLGLDNDDDLSDYMPVAYFGTAITGTVEAGTVFASSGIVLANAGDAYFNNQNGNTYICVVAGDANTAQWSYRTTFDYSDAVNWYNGTAITIDVLDNPIPLSGVTNAAYNEYYFNTSNGDIFRCTKGGDPTIAMWEYVWNIFWQVTPGLLLSVYRVEANGSYVEIASGIDNTIQSSDSAISVRDPHPAFNGCTYRITAQDPTDGALGFADILKIYDETSVIIQWAEKWVQDTDDPTIEMYDGSLLELPANITLSDSAAVDSTLVEYEGRDRPVSYYGTQQGESAKITGDIPKDDTTTLSLLRRLMVYKGDAYIRDPSGLGYWANIKPDYGRNYNSLTIPITLTITPVEGGM